MKERLGAFPITERSSSESTRAVLEGDSELRKSWKQWIIQRNSRIMFAGMVLSTICLVLLIGVIVTPVNLSRFCDFHIFLLLFFVFCVF